MEEATWKPRKGSPAAAAGESQAEYSARLKRERNRRHHATKARARAAAKPAAKLLAQAATPRRPRPAAERPPLRSILRTRMGQRSFDPDDEQEIEQCLAWLDGQPEIEDVDADTIRTALRNVEPGTLCDLAAEQPTPP